MTDNERITRLQSHELHGVLPETPIAQIVITNTALGSKALTLNGYTLVVGKHDGKWMIVWRSSNRAMATRHDLDTCAALLAKAGEMMGDD
jgi:hypothetical protein